MTGNKAIQIALIVISLIVCYEACYVSFDVRSLRNGGRSLEKRNYLQERKGTTIFNFSYIV